MAEVSETSSDTIAFPRLECERSAALKPLATSCSFGGWAGVISRRAGGADLFVWKRGRSKSSIHRMTTRATIVTHGPGHLLGISILLTRRPVIGDGDCARADTVDAGGGSTIAGGVESDAAIEREDIDRHTGAAALADSGRCIGIESGGAGEMPGIPCRCGNFCLEFRSVYVV